ncbi:hypothetical protein GCM10023321_72560 [Pseudonocardia eucalypti]|uniref:Uncharacterized protein n=1 Tax=Pseudonocardia eucalypti TaxID=648755 RepID=A0ABP9R7V2_9PSEU|nr:hypothetical protein [Pseudonocardia eucalypti]
MPTNPNPTPPRRRTRPRDHHATERRQQVIHAVLVVLAFVATMAYLCLVPALVLHLLSSTATRAGVTAAPTTTAAAEGPLAGSVAAFATTSKAVVLQAPETAPETASGAAVSVPATVTAPLASVAPVALTHTIRATEEDGCGSRVRAGLVDICLDLDPDTPPGAYSVNDRDKDRDPDKDRDGARRCACNDRDRDRDRDGDVYYYPAPGRDEDPRRPGGWPSYRPGYPSNPGPYSYPGAPNQSGPQVCRFYQPGEHRDLPDGGAICTRVTR